LSGLQPLEKKQQKKDVLELASSNVVYHPAFETVARRLNSVVRTMLPVI
jgi:hypothetical protein